MKKIVIIISLIIIAGCELNDSEMNNDSKPVVVDDEMIVDDEKEVSVEMDYINYQNALYHHRLWIYKQYPELDIEEDILSIEIHSQNQSAITLENTQLLNRFKYELLAHYEVTIGSPVRSEIGSFSYVIHKDDISIEIDIVAPNIYYDPDSGKYYKAGDHLHQLGRAFLTNAEHVLDVPSLYKVRDAALLMEEGGHSIISFDPGFIQSFSSIVAQSNIMEFKSDEVPLMVFDFYRYGEIITLYVHEHGFTIIDQDEQNFYEQEGAHESIVSFISTS